MPEVVVAGHICLDVIPAFPETGVAPRLDPGSLLWVGPAVRATGGAVANTGLALHKLGTSVALVGKIGDDAFGREIVDLLRGRGNSLAHHILTQPGDATSYSIVISPPGVDRIFLHCPGANATFSPVDVDWARLGAFRLLHFGYPPLMRGMYGDGGEAMRSLFDTARGRGAATSLDLCGIDPGSEADRVDWPSWLDRVLPAVDFVLPSFDETLTVLRRPTCDITPDSLRSVSEALLKAGAAVVVLKLGDQGLYLRTTGDASRLAQVGGAALSTPGQWCGRELLSPCFQAAVVGTTGSGDCTIAGFLAAVLRGAGPEAALEAACAVGACSVESPDATGGVVDWSALRARLASGWRRRAPGDAFDGWHPVAQGVYAGRGDASVKRL